MKKNDTREAPAHKAVRRQAILVLACSGLAAVAQAQAPAEAPSEAARRAAMGPFRMILQDSAAPRKPAPLAPAAPRKTASRAAEPPAPATPATAAVQPPAAPPAATAATAAIPAASPAPSPVAAVPPAATTAVPPPAVAAAPAAAPARVPRTALVPVKQDPPELTAALLREQASGTVKVSFQVRPDGSTNDVQVVSTTNRKLVGVSTQAVRNWKFQPIDEPKVVEVEFAFK